MWEEVKLEKIVVVLLESTSEKLGEIVNILKKIVSDSNTEFIIGSLTYIIEDIICNEFLTLDNKRRITSSIVDDIENLMLITEGANEVFDSWVDTENLIELIYITGNDLLKELSEYKIKKIPLSDLLKQGSFDLQDIHKDNFAELLSVNILENKGMYTYILNIGVHDFKANMYEQHTEHDRYKYRDEHRVI